MYPKCGHATVTAITPTPRARGVAGLMGQYLRMTPTTTPWTWT